MEEPLTEEQIQAVIANSPELMDRLEDGDVLALAEIFQALGVKVQKMTVTVLDPPSELEE